MIDVSSFYGLIQMECRRCGLTRVYSRGRAFRWLETHLRGCSKPGADPAPKPKPEPKPASPRRTRRWSADDIATLLANHDREAARLLGRSPDACRHKRNKLKEATS